MWSQFGKILILIGVLTILLGGILIFAEKLPWLGKLPGDIVVKKKNFSLYFPTVTSLVLSVVLSVAVAIFSHLFRK